MSEQQPNLTMPQAGAASAAPLVDAKDVMTSDDLLTSLPAPIVPAPATIVPIADDNLLLDLEDLTSAPPASNNAGGVLGGISTGQELRVSIAIKPTSSIRTPRRSIDRDGTPTVVETKGRHDPCVGIRATPVVEAMLALVLMDHMLLHRAYDGAVSLPVPPIEGPVWPSA